MNEKSIERVVGPAPCFARRLPNEMVSLETLLGGVKISDLTRERSNART